MTFWFYLFYPGRRCPHQSRRFNLKQDFRLICCWRLTIKKSVKVYLIEPWFNASFLCCCINRFRRVAYWTRTLVPSKMVLNNPSRRRFCKNHPAISVALFWASPCNKCLLLLSIVTLSVSHYKRYHHCLSTTLQLVSFSCEHQSP